MTNGKIFSTVRHKKKAPHMIIDQIRNTILEGRLSPGDKLPSEQELSEHFEVSRQTLREAMRTLEYLGFLEIRAGANGGAFVSEVDMKTTMNSLANFLHFKNLSINHISEIRKIIEPYDARIAADRITEEELETLGLINEKFRKALSGGDMEVLQYYGIRFHRTIAQITRNPILILIVDFVENLLEDVKNILKPDIEFQERVIDSHELIFNALKDRDPDRAAEEMFKDITQVEASLLSLAEDNPVIKWS